MLDKNEILELLHFRHACKEFDAERKIGDHDFSLILEAGRLSPSSFGIEPWRFVVVQDMALREKIRAVTWGAQKQLPTCSHYVLLLCRRPSQMRFDSAYVSDYMRQVQKSPDEIWAKRIKVYEEFQQNDADLADNPRALFDWSVKQTYIALANMMTIAAMLGIDSCPIEGYKHAEMEQLLSTEFGLDVQQWGLGVMVAFGYRVQPARPKARLPLEEVIEWR